MYPNWFLPEIRCSFIQLFTPTPIVGLFIYLFILFITFVCFHLFTRLRKFKYLSKTHAYRSACLTSLVYLWISRATTVVALRQNLWVPHDTTSPALTNGFPWWPSHTRGTQFHVKPVRDLGGLQAPKQKTLIRYLYSDIYHLSVLGFKLHPIELVAFSATCQIISGPGSSRWFPHEEIPAGQGHGAESPTLAVRKMASGIWRELQSPHRVDHLATWIFSSRAKT